MQASGESAEAQRALAQLCQTYWLPIYAYLRRRYSPEQAEDLTQEFFAREVLTRRIFKGVDPLHGRFRAWLLASLKHLVANAADARDTIKRGGRAQHVSIDETAEDRYQLANTAALSPEQLYERTWALMLLERARAVLRRQYEASGRGQLFAAIEGGLPGPAPARPSADVAAELGKSEDAVRVAVHRLRKEFGDVLRDEVGRTVCSAEDVDAELRDLLAAFG
jgi:RNA polymerase sigma-70 factor (ECF subfamily)